jgi:hypothetical protein
MQSVSVLAILALALSCTLAIDVTLDQYWNTWKQVNKKQYSDAEEQVRYERFVLIYRFCLLIIKKFCF